VTRIPFQMHVTGAVSCEDDKPKPGKNRHLDGRIGWWLLTVSLFSLIWLTKM